jgi:hypothetical protein
MNTGLVSPSMLAVPNTEPGAIATIRCPVKTSKTPGTFRLCMKMGWPNGVYCFPNTLVGMIFTTVVLSEPLSQCLGKFPYSSAATQSE